MEKLIEVYVRLMMGLQAARKGQGLVEYVLILVLISIIAIAAMSALGLRVTAIFDEVRTALKG